MRMEPESVTYWIRKSKNRIESYGKKGAFVSAKELLWQGPLHMIGKHIWNYGSHIFNQNWKVLIILDACRCDLMKDIIQETDFKRDKVEEKYSVASHTYEWMRKTFSKQFSNEIEDTVYITGNPHSDEVLDESQFEQLHETWRYSRNEFGTVPSRAITNQAIRTMREKTPNRLIIHYMQPHQPFRMFSKIEESDKWTNYDVWQLLELGELDADLIWRAYKDNLKWVMDDVSLLLSNINADKVILSSDHGNAFGEAGLYGHPKFVPHPVLKKVPWIELTANDERTYDPGMNHRNREKQVNVEESLDALGYI